MWTKYKVTWNFITKLCASVPADPEIVKKWIEARKPRVRPAGGKSIDEIQEEVFASLAVAEEEQPTSLLVFQRHHGQLVMRAGTVRAHLKDCARTLSAEYIGSIEGDRNFSTRFICSVYPDPYLYWIPILRPDGEPVTSADGTFDKPVHPRPGLSALKTFEYIEPARMDFTLWVLTAMSGAAKGKGEKRKRLPSITQEDLHKVMRYGGVHGYAGERGDGEGKYLYEIERIEDDAE